MGDFFLTRPRPRDSRTCDPAWVRIPVSITNLGHYREPFIMVAISGSDRWALGRPNIHIGKLHCII
jgi:hypothetical protein